MVMSGRSFTSDAYRYGFNGKEQDQEGMGGGASTYDYGFRIYNPGIAKFLSVDPLTKKYPWYTPYQFAGNMPVWATDLDGKEPEFQGSTPNQYACAPIKDGCTDEPYGWSWDGCDWIQGDKLNYRGGLKNPWEDITGDLNTEYDSKQEIVDWRNCSDLPDEGTGCHEFAFSGSFRNGISLETQDAQNEALTLYYNFINGSANDLSSFLSFGANSVMAGILQDEAFFSLLGSSFTRSVQNYFELNGSLNGFDGTKAISDFRLSMKTCGENYLNSQLYMFTVMGGYCTLDVQINEIVDRQVSLTITIWDHFGADSGDAVSNLPGLASLYYLQKNTISNNIKYKPFVWNIRANYFGK